MGPCLVVNTGLEQKADAQLKVSVAVDLESLSVPHDVHAAGHEAKERAQNLPGQLLPLISLAFNDRDVAFKA